MELALYWPCRKDDDRNDTYFSGQIKHGLFPPGTVTPNGGSIFGNPPKNLLIRVKEFTYSNLPPAFWFLLDFFFVIESAQQLNT